MANLNQCNRMLKFNIYDEDSFEQEEMIFKALKYALREQDFSRRDVV
jgi:hypothetical protein